MAPSTEGEATAPSVAKGNRQRAGAACEECRRRKLRCDGQLPQCSVCRESGLACEVTQRGARGPRKGDLRALRSRVAELEALLEDAHQRQHQHGSSNSSGDFAISTEPAEASDSTAVDYAHSWFPMTAPSFSDPGMLLPDNALLDMGPFADWPLPSTLPPAPDTNLHITGLMHAELDQLYWDRVHPSIPILHQRRYLSWSKSTTKTSSQSCLQHAMWTLATLMSAQLRDMTDPLYHETKKRLGPLTIEGNEHSSHDTELVQSWVLIATCESMRTFHREAWMSGGRAFRLVQGLRYHEIDSDCVPGVLTSLGEDAPVMTEERRRVFWMAYFLDHILGIRNDWPLTLCDEMILTRLPVADTDFQSCQDVVGLFLQEVMAKPELSARSPFNECLVLATICGRSLSQAGRFKASKTQTGDTIVDWAEQHRSLHRILSSRHHVLSKYYPLPTEAYDPLVWLANILAQAAVVYCCKSAIDSMADTESTSDEASRYHQKILSATKTIVHLATGLRELHISKIHPLTPIPLFLTAEFLFDQRFTHESFLLRLREMVEVLGHLKNVNNPDQSYMDLLPRSCIPKSAQLLDHATKEQGNGH